MNEQNRTTEPVQVRKLVDADLEPVTDVMARAFDDDPFANAIAKQDAKRSERIRAFMEVAVKKLTFPFGETYVAGDYLGAALWNPPNGRPHGTMNDLRLIPAMVRTAGLKDLPRVIGMLTLAEKKHPKEPHYYLLGIGVDPRHQGRGIGTQLMAPVLERCDREGMPAYLESSKERNVPLYERNGFKVVEALDLSKDGPRIWRMWRDPR